MTRITKNKIIQVATVIMSAVVFIFAATWVKSQKIEQQKDTSKSVLRSSSALRLANLSLEIEREKLEIITKQLGANISSETIYPRWKILHSQMQGAGASPQEATGVLQGVAQAKCPTVKASYSHPPRMWPVLATEGRVKDKKVWIVHLAYWAPPTMICGNSTKEEIRGLSLAYRIYVIDGNAPYQCWIPPLLLQSLPKEEHKAYISDDESLKEYRKRLRQ